VKGVLAETTTAWLNFDFRWKALCAPKIRTPTKKSVIQTVDFLSSEF